MFGNSKGDRGKRKGADLMNQLGMNAMPGLGMPGMDPSAYGPGDDDDDDLEAELAALAGEEYKPPKRKSKPQKKAPLSMSEIERMAAQGIESFDDDVSDTEDPDLMAELQDLEEDDDDDGTNDQPSSPPKQPSPTKAQLPNIAAPSQGVYQPTIAPSQASPISPAPRQNPSPSPRSLNSPKPAPPSSWPSGPSTMSPGRPSPAPARPSAGGVVGLLEERLAMYKQASAQAKAAGEGSKQRRMDRGVKNLTDMLKQAKAGKPVNEEEIPPQVHVAGAATPPSQASSSTSSSASTPSPVTPAASIAGPSTSVAPRPSSSNAESTKLALATRRDQYKKAALMAKRDGDIPKATGYVRTAKQFDAMIEALDQGKAVDLSQMPPVPPEFSGGAKQQTTQQPQSSVPVQRSVPQGAGGQSKQDEEEDAPQSTLEEAKALFGAPDTPRTAMEALTQRLAKYKETESAAKTEGNGSKARRMGRIVKQYEDAVKCVKAGKPVDFEELPTPPGFDPIPVGKLAGPPPQAAASTVSPTRPAPTAQPPPHPSTVAARAAPAPPAGAASASAGAAKNPPIQRQNTARKSTSRADQQLAFLLERKGEFKEAAMKAKKNHDLELAKKYVRMMKGIEPMVDALEAGLPVDLSQVPPSPSESQETEFVVVNAEDCTPTGDREEVFKSLQEDLVRQIRVSVSNAQHYQKLGDVPTTAKFQKMEQNSRRDLESLKSAYRHGDPAPRFHYEMRTFSMVQSNTDLGEADMEVTIERGIQYNLPSGYSEKDMDTAVKYEMAYPSEHPQSGGTSTVKDTINPEYKETFKLEISRASKSFFRFVERKALKLEVYLKRGFFKGDKLLGTVNVKLQPLESKCTLHDSFDLMDGRKTAGGKLEVKIRIRDPFKSKQVEEVKEKWLVIDQFIRTAGSQSQADAKTQKSARSEQTEVKR